MTGKPSSTSVTAPEPQELVDVSTDLQQILGPPPLHPGEDVEAYDQLYGRLRAAVSPADTLEELWVRDIADLAWETLRLRRLKAKFMQSRVRDGLSQALRNFLPDYAERKELLSNWARGLPEARQEVDRLIEAADEDRGVIEARALTDGIDLFERIDQMIMQSEARRNAALREIDRHRDAVARRMREALAIEEAEFEDLPRTKVAE